MPRIILGDAEFSVCRLCAWAPGLLPPKIPGSNSLRGERRWNASPGAVLGWREATMSHARPIMTQEEWNRRHQREEHRQRRNEIISRVALFFSFVAISVAFYFMTMVR